MLCRGGNEVVFIAAVDFTQFWWYNLSGDPGAAVLGLILQHAISSYPWMSVQAKTGRACGNLTAGPIIVMEVASVGPGLFDIHRLIIWMIEKR